MGNRVVVQAAQRVQQQQLVRKLTPIEDLFFLILTHITPTHFKQQPRENDAVDLQRNEGAIVPLSVTQSIWQQASEGVASIAQIPIGVLLNRKST